MSAVRFDRVSTAGPVEARSRLEPEGTAKLRFLRARGRAERDSLADVYARAGALDLPPALIDVARFAVDLAERPLTPTERTALLHLLLVVVLDTRLGSTRSLVGGTDGARHLRNRLEPLVGVAEAEAAPAAIAALLDHGVPGVVSSAPAAPSGPVPLIVTENAVAPHRLFVLERRIVRAVTARMTSAPAFEDNAVGVALADVQSRPTLRGGEPSPLSDEQASAVARAARQRLTLISGGPGTGKTSIVVALVRIAARLGIPAARILVAAPTGKAANRATEALRLGFDQLGQPSALDLALKRSLPAAETLHRLLGYHPRRGRFARDRNDALAADVVVVDEASMIDLRLMDALLDAVPPAAQLVLLGDADQLPSVDAGAILRDLRASDGPARYSVQLTHSYRMDAADPRGAEILRAARAVRAGRPPVGEVRTRPQRLTHGGLEQLQAEDIDARRRFLDLWVERHLASRSHQRAARRILLHRNGDFRADDVRGLDRLLERLNRFKALAVTRSAALTTGAEALNRAIHERLVPLMADEDPGFLPGEPVMMLRNDYERGLFNGDVGVAMMVAVDSHAAAPMFVFRTARGYEPFPQALLQQDIALAHAMTVHKAQGSEFDEVALILPEVDLPILTREVLYTGLTRARTSVILVGAPVLTARAVARPVVRHSGLVIPASIPPD